jgi:hypothetical protein
MAQAELIGGRRCDAGGGPIHDKHFIVVSVQAPACLGP